jgi:hypothetical protein
LILLTFYPIEPLSLKSYRQALYPSGAQGDQVDAALLVQFLLKHYSGLRCHRPQSAPVRQGTQYCENRRRFIAQRAQALQCLKASLKLYFPLALELFEDLATSLARGFLQRWSTLEELQRVRPATVRLLLPSRIAQPQAHPTPPRTKSIGTERFEKISKPLSPLKRIEG